MINFKGLMKGENMSDFMDSVKERHMDNSSGAVTLKIGDDTYAKRKYSPLEIGDLASAYLFVIGNKNSKELGKLYLEALKEVSCNGEALDTELKLNNHFAKFPERLREVRTWALLGEAKCFLDSYYNDTGELSGFI
jgi:hypothetical protein